MADEGNPSLEGQPSVDLYISADGTHGFIGTSNYDKDWRTANFCSQEGAQIAVNLLKKSQMITEEEAALLLENIKLCGLPENLNRVPKEVIDSAIKQNEDMVQEAVGEGLAIIALAAGNLIPNNTGLTN